MSQITISGTPINIPDSGQSPNWAPAIVEAFQLIAEALSASVGDFDVAPQTLNIDAYNPGTDVDVPNLTFPVNSVQGAFVRYAVLRTTSTTTSTQTGNLIVNYNSGNSPGSLWEISDEKVGDAGITFTITDTGQIQFTTTTLGGLNHTGSLFYTAQAMLN